jgi:large subunit ribosomal protein L19e
LKVGYNRVWIDPERAKEAETAITRKEVSKLIKDGVIKARPDKGVSRSRAKILHKKKRKGRRSNAGSREGAKYARMPKKDITNTTYRKLYALAKGGAFRDVSHLRQHIESKELYRRKR